MPFRSKAQWKFAFARNMPWAKKWAHQTTGTRKAGTKKGSRAYRSLPAHKKKSGGKKKGR